MKLAVLLVALGADLVRWDGEAGTRGPEPCHPAQLVPEGAPDEDDA